MKLYGDEYAPENTGYINHIYFHGKLEAAIGYDIICAEDDIPDGISHHETVLPDGTTVPCTAYVWTFEEKFEHEDDRYDRYDAHTTVYRGRRGLVIADDEDEEIVNSVLARFEEKPNYA